MEDLGDRAGYAPGRERSKEFGLRSLRLDRDLVPGMAITIEPGLYQVESILQNAALTRVAGDRLDRKKLAAFADVRGIRIEDDVLLTESGREVLTERSQVDRRRRGRRRPRAGGLTPLTQPTGITTDSGPGLPAACPSEVGWSVAARRQDTLESRGHSSSGQPEKVALSTAAAAGPVRSSGRKSPPRRRSGVAHRREPGAPLKVTPALPPGRWPAQPPQWALASHRAG